MNTLDQFFYPFRSLDHMLKAIVIVKALNHSASNNLDKIAACFENYFKYNIAEQQIKNFIDKISIYSNYIGADFIVSFNTFKNSIQNYAMQNDLPSKQLTAAITSCVFCQNSGTNWFTVTAGRFAITPTLYDANQIGKKINLHLKI